MNRVRFGRLVLEAVVIIASILAAFALDRWWESRSDKVEEQIALGALESEFRAARDELQRHYDYEARIFQSIQSLLDSLTTAVEHGAARVSLPDTALAHLYVSPTVQLVLGTREGLVSSGRLTLIRDHELRAALGGWGTLLADMQEEQMTSWQLVHTDLDRVVRTRAVVAPFRDLGQRLYRNAVSESVRSATSVVEVDREILGVVATRKAVAERGLNQYEAVFAEIDSILALIGRASNPAGGAS